MSRTALLCNVAIIAVFVYLGFGLFQQARSSEDQAIMLRNKVEDLHKQMGGLLSLTDAPAKDVAVYYQGLDEYAAAWGGFYDLKMNLEAAAETKPSCWESIQQLSLKLNFHQIGGLQTYLRIFEFLKTMQREYPLNVNTVEQKGNNLEVLADLFGK